MDSLAGCANSKIATGLGRAQDQMRPLPTVTVPITPLLGDIISQVVAVRTPIQIVARLNSRDQLELRLQILAPNLVGSGFARTKAAPSRFLCATLFPAQR